MTDLDAIRARHYPCDAHEGEHCQAEGESGRPWPCDTAIVLAALDKCIAGEDIVLAHDQRDAAIEREQRLRAALPEALRAVCSCTEQCDHDGVEWHAVSADFLAAVLLEQMDALATEGE